MQRFVFVTLTVLSLLFTACAPTMSGDPRANRRTTLPPGTVIPVQQVTPPTPAQSSTLPSSTSTKDAPEWVSNCVADTAKVRDGALLATYVSPLNASSSGSVQALEEALATLDSDYSCGTFAEVDPNSRVRIIRIYEVSNIDSTMGDVSGNLSTLVNALPLANGTRVGVLLRYTGGRSQALLKLPLAGMTTVLSPIPAAQDSYLSRLARSKRTFVSSSREATTQQQSPVSSTRTDLYNCSDFSSAAAAQAFFESSAGDPNRLDADNDGRACESFANSSYRWTVRLPVARPLTPVSTPSYSAPKSSGPKKCYVNGYTKKNGTKVSGYYRSC